MKQQIMKKSFFTLGLLLLFTLLMLAAPLGSSKAYASTTDKNNDYRLNLKSITMVKGKTFTLKAYNKSNVLGDNAKLSFKSEDSDVASINSDGVMSANRVGVTVITVTIKEGFNNSFSLTCDVTVGPPAFSIKTSKSLIVLGIDATDTLRVILRPSNTGETARFSSKDEEIATISSGGRVTGKKAGLTYLFGEIDALGVDGSRKFSKCTVIVTSKVDASSIEAYFNDHPELDLINEDDLSSVLEGFFNRKSEEAKNYISSNSSIVDALDKYLNSIYNLSALKERQNSN